MRKAVIITGASRGIGRATALLAGQRGWSVGVNYLKNKSAAEKVVASVVEAGGQGVSLQGDVTVETDVTTMFDAAEQALGEIDGVVINAGIAAPSSPLIDMSTERLRRMFEVNVLGSYVCARESARKLVKSRGGRGGAIVFVSSIASRLGSPFEFVDYAGAKAAIDTLTMRLAKELGAEGVRVNAVRPGLIDTDIHASIGQPDRAWRLGKTTPLGRVGLPEEVAEAIVWLLSDAASYTTGAVIDVAGGR